MIYKAPTSIKNQGACLSFHTTFSVIVAGASPGETKMWAVVNYFVTVVNYTIFAAIIDSFMSN